MAERRDGGDMRERPILFSGPMVNAILSGQKTMTRRVVKPSRGLQSTWTSVEQLAKCPTNYLCDVDGAYGAQFQHPLAGQVSHGVYNEPDSPYGWVKCPYGKPGDRLWVRETHFVFEGYGGDPDAVCYRADDAVLYSHGDGLFGSGNPYGIGEAKASDVMAGDLWKPSIFMPRWASRITLEITNVRVERLQDITEADVAAEGVPNDPYDKEHDFIWRDVMPIPVANFHYLWDKLNAKRGFGWDVDPYVWVVEFKRVENV